jgi:hypothetical protein
MDQGPTVPFNATNWSKTLSGSLHNCAEGIRRPEKSQQQGSTKNSQFEATLAASIKLSIQGQITAARSEASLVWRIKRLERCSSWYPSQHLVNPTKASGWPSLAQCSARQNQAWSPSADEFCSVTEDEAEQTSGCPPIGFQKDNLARVH